MEYGTKVRCYMPKQILEYPNLMKEWNYEKNKELRLNPNSIYDNCCKKAWWKCNNGHDYYSIIRVRAHGSGCPYCNKGVLLKGFNDLKTINSELAKEWHPTKNGDLTPTDVTANNGKKVWWLDKCGHEWEAIVARRNKGSKCPYCTNEKLLVGFNDFATKNPNLLDEWDYDKNDVLPTEIFSTTHKKIWWKCPFGHSYLTFPYNRIRSRCPICDKENHTSFPEQAIYYYLKKHFKDIENSNTNCIGMELDIYIPSIKTAIEYDGINWHNSSVNKDIKKNTLCKENNIKLIRIREPNLPIMDNCITIERKDKKTDESLNAVIKELLFYLGINSEVIDVSNDSPKIYNQYIKNRKEKSVAKKYPELAKEWHPTKNDNLLPSMVNYGSSKKVWWLGKCGHEWQMTINDRTVENCGCPICSGKRIVSGINDLLSKYPKVCEEWFYDKNNSIGLYPNSVAPHSDKKAWWKCKSCGNVWQAKIDHRTRLGVGCPRCGRKKVEQSRYKAVKCVETGIVYKSIIDAENKTGINRICISQCCKNKQTTAGKLHWKFEKDDK